MKIEHVSNIFCLIQPLPYYTPSSKSSSSSAWAAASVALAAEQWAKSTHNK